MAETGRGIYYPSEEEKGQEDADILIQMKRIAESVDEAIGGIDDDKVNKIQGKGLSTNDYTDDEKSKLAGIATGAEVNVIETLKVNGTALTPSNKAVDVPVPTKTSDLTNDSGFIDKDVNNLANYYKKTEVDTKISSVYKYKGTVSTYADLPSSNLTVGDVYNIETADSTHGVKAGDNVAWNGNAWDVLAGTVDLSGKEDKSNKVTEIDENSTDEEYPSAKLLYDELEAKQEQIDALVTENSTMKKQFSTSHASGTSFQLTDSAEDLPIEHVKIEGATSQAILPTGYTQIDYIESTGTQYIDTNYTPVQGDSFEFKNVSFTSNGDSQALFSAGTGDYQLIFLIFMDNSYFKYFSTGSAATIPVSSFNNANIRINNGEFYINDVLKTIVNYGGAVNTSLNLFRRTGNVSYANAKIGEIIISNNNIIKKHYIPAQRNSDNAVGLYEIVGNTFYNNGGTGTFSKGNEVPNPDFPQIIHTVTGDCEVEVVNKNLFDINKVTSIINGSITDDVITSNPISSDYGGVSVNISNLILNAGTYYTSMKVKRVSGTNAYNINKITLVGVENSQMISKPNLSSEYQIYSCSFSANEPITLTNIGIQLQANNDNVVLEIKDIMISANSDTTYIPHAEQNAPLNLGNTELYAEDEIEIDYVQKAGYKKVTGARFVKNMGKVVLDGSESQWSMYGSSGQRKWYLQKSYFGDLVPINATGNKSNRFKNSNYISGNWDLNKFGWHHSASSMVFDTDFGESLEEWKTWLSTHNTKVVYKLATPITTEITDPTLLAQLEVWINLKTYKQITNIESTGTDLAPVIEFGYYQDLSTVISELRQAIIEIGGE